VPLAEFVILGIVFILGILPRLLDGYGLTDTTPQTVFRKAFCGPDDPLQAHAVWHFMSAIALALTYDLLEKARPVYESSPATILLPQGPELRDLLAAPTREQGVAPIVVKFVVTAASVLLLFLALYNRSVLGGIGSGVALLLPVWLWLWPLGSR
jgi:hypothetical protein